MGWLSKTIRRRGILLQRISPDKAVCTEHILDGPSIVDCTAAARLRRRTWRIAAINGGSVTARTGLESVSSPDAFSCGFAAASRARPTMKPQ